MGYFGRLKYFVRSAFIQFSSVQFLDRSGHRGHSTDDSALDHVEFTPRLTRHFKNSNPTRKVAVELDTLSSIQKEEKILIKKGGGYFVTIARQRRRSKEDKQYVKSHQREDKRGPSLSLAVDVDKPDTELSPASATKNVIIYSTDLRLREKNRQKN